MILSQIPLIFEQALKQWAMHLQTYYDRYNLLKAVLNPTVFLNWRAAYHEKQARTNLEYNLHVPFDMLTAYGQEAVKEPKEDQDMET